MSKKVILNNDDHWNIRQLSQEIKRVEKSYALWSTGQYMWPSKLLFSRIEIIINECRYLLNRGTVPSDPKKRLAKSTINRINLYMARWSGIYTEIKKSGQVEHHVLSTGYQRSDYDEASISEVGYPAKDLKGASTRQASTIQLGKRGITRSYTIDDASHY